LNNLLAGIGIPNLGKTMSGPIAEEFKHLNVLCTATVSQIESIDGVGHELAQSIVQWFADSNHMDMINYFIDNNIACEAKPSLVKSKKLNGKVFVIWHYKKSRLCND
jgi:DNA ligase (NAD+)